jgi:ribonucleoside-diphosphate reductase alpha chain
VFIDRVQDERVEEGPIVTCVPCGEQFMHDNETCNLGSINLTNLLYRDSQDDQIKFDWDLYRSAINTAVLFMDQVIDLYQIPDQIMAQTAVRLRRIGLGVMGFARMLQLMGIPYQSKQALWWADQLAQTLTEEADKTSWSITPIDSQHRRNITVTCVAPTGGIRNLVDTDSYSIEPLFTECSSIDPVFSVKMTAAWQKHLENAISKTINLANGVDVSVVLDVIVEAYHNKLKGITVYRDGSRSFQPKKIKCDGDSCQLS